MFEGVNNYLMLFGGAIIFLIVVLLIALPFIIINKRSMRGYVRVDTSKLEESSINEQKKSINNKKEEKIRSYIEKMSLSQVVSLLPDDVYKKTPKKRNLLNEALINEVLSGKIDFKDDGIVHYIASDKMLEDDKDYYFEGVKEKKDDIKHFESIRKDTGYKVNMTEFNEDIFASLFDKDGNILNAMEIEDDNTDSN